MFGSNETKLSEKNEEKNVNSLKEDEEVAPINLTYIYVFI